jgi:hypothetical protein
MIASWRDPLMLDPGLPVTYASFGGQRRRAVDGRVTSAMNDRPRASVVLDVNSEQPVDYLAELKIITKTAGSERVLFTGFADSGEVDGNTVVIEAQGATELAERSTGRLAIKSAPAVDVIYLMARDAGYSDDRLQIQGLDDLPLELFQVMVPVAGIETWCLIGSRRRHPVAGRDSWASRDCPPTSLCQSRARFLWLCRSCVRNCQPDVRRRSPGRGPGSSCPGWPHGSGALWAVCPT